MIAADAPVDHLFALLWRGEPVIATATARRVRGRLVAPSQPSAALAVLATTGTPPVRGAPTGKGALVSLSFGSVPQREIFRILAETLRASIVVGPAPLPEIAIVFNRVPADAAIAALAAFDELAVNRVGSTFYLLPKGAVLPPRPKVASTATVSLVTTDATPQIASAVIAALQPFPISCATTPLHLDLRRMLPAEAARAIAVASGAQPGGSCPLDELAAVDPAQATLVAVATVGTRRAAVVRVGGVPKLVKSSPTIHIFDAGLTVGGAELSALPQFDPPAADYASWRARVVRATAVVRFGTTWLALLETATGEVVLLDPQAQRGMLETRRVEINASGVAITDDTGRVDTLPLR